MIPVPLFSSTPTSPYDDKYHQKVNLTIRNCKKYQKLLASDHKLLQDNNPHETLNPKIHKRKRGKGGVKTNPQVKNAQRSLNLLISGT